MLMAEEVGGWLGQVWSWKEASGGKEYMSCSLEGSRNRYPKAREEQGERPSQGLIWGAG